MRSFTQNALAMVFALAASGATFNALIVNQLKACGPPRLNRRPVGFFFASPVSNGQFTQFALQEFADMASRHLFDSVKR